MKIGEVTQQEFLERLQSISEGIMPVLSEFCDKYGLSGLSAMTIAHLSIVQGLQSCGGPASKLYMQATIDGAFCTDPREGEKINRRGRMQMEKMSQFYDLLVSQGTGRRQ